MQTKKLISMTQFILDIDWMSTTEFCKNTGAPLPRFIPNDVNASADQFLRLDCIKWRMVKDYAKFLNKNLIEDMFIGKRPMFPGFVKSTQMDATMHKYLLSFDNYGNDGLFQVTQFKESPYNSGKKCFVTTLHLKTVEDLVKLDIDFIQYNDYYK